MSNWINDTAAAGDRAARGAAGRYDSCCRKISRIQHDLVAFAGGSGITPIMSLVRTALAASARPIKLFYANRARDSVIFSEQLGRPCRPPTPTGLTSSTTTTRTAGS